MAEINTIRVFLSYTGADNVVARRVYDDLARSGYDVWSYEADGALGENYARDYEHELDTRDFFCLLDSAVSRTSPHVRRECRLARARKDREPSFGIVPCLICDRSPNWFDSDLLFPEQPMLQYVNLSLDYQSGMERLCRHLGGRKYFPFSELPEDSDFLEEIVASPRIALETFGELTRMYRRFREDCGRDPASSRAFIVSVINVLRKSGPEGIASPSIALGVLESDSGNFTAAAGAFDEATRNRPGCDRAWCASAGAQMALVNYARALRDYRACRALLVDGHPNLDNLPMVVFGIAMAHFNLNDPRSSAGYLDGEWRRVHWHGRILQLRARLFLAEGRPELALPLLVNSKAYFERMAETVPVDVHLALAQTFRDLRPDQEEAEAVSQAVAQFERDPEALRSTTDQMIERTSLLPRKRHAWRLLKLVAS